MLSFRNCIVTWKSIKNISKRCMALERLEIPVNDMVGSFSADLLLAHQSL